MVNVKFELFRAIHSASEVFLLASQFPTKESKSPRAAMPLPASAPASPPKAEPGDSRGARNRRRIRAVFLFLRTEGSEVSIRVRIITSAEDKADNFLGSQAFCLDFGGCLLDAKRNVANGSNRINLPL